MEESKSKSLDKHTRLLTELSQAERWKEFAKKLETMTEDERMTSFQYIDPETNMTFLESA